MTFQLIALDLDGTLLDSQHRISHTNAAAVQACMHRGIRVVLATGRMFRGMRSFCTELGLDGPQITLNGAVIADPSSGTLHARQLLSADMLAAVTTQLTLRGIEWYVYGVNETYALPGTDNLERLAGYGELPAEVVPSLERDSIPEPTKVIAFLGEGPLDAELRALLGDQTEVVRSSSFFLEFLAPGTTKGAALTELMTRFEIRPEEVLAMGDSYNDMSMFAVAGTSVAMGSAVADLQARATYTTASCDEDGVALALHRYVLGTGRGQA